MLQLFNSYVQNFVGRKDWATPADTQNPYFIVIHSNKRPSHKHVHSYNGPQYLEIAAVYSRPEDGIVVCHNIFNRQR